MLKKKGMYAGEETGKLNPETRAAIGEWQTQNSVKKTGTLNKETLEAMKIELTDRQMEF
jgi:peptidoglycan hydrolase-like protein with peptidoglycan-binding domain